MKEENWTQIKDYLWGHTKKPLQVMIFKNEDKDSIYCVYVKLKDEDGWSSNYFVYDRENEDVSPFEFAESIHEKFHEKEKEEK